MVYHLVNEDNKTPFWTDFDGTKFSLYKGMLS